MAEEPQAPSSARLGAEAGEYDDGLSAFAGVRPRLFGIAYRMLGSAAEAEDVVQDVWLRWQSTNSYDQIASILQMEEANVRQLVSRARKHIAGGRRKSVSSNEQRRLLEAFVTAAQKGDMAALEGLLAEDVVSYADGGGLVRARESQSLVANV